MTTHRRSLQNALVLCALALLAWGCDSDPGVDTQDPTANPTADTNSADTQTPDTQTAEDTQTSEDTQTAPDTQTNEDTQTAADTSPTTPDADTPDTNTTPPLLDEYPFVSETAYPESVTFDPVERAFYTGSLGDGTITRTDAGGQQSEFFAGNDAGEWLVLGLEVDAARRRLWACAALGRDLTESEVWLFDLESGERLWQSSLQSVHVGSVCSDMIITADGTAYACDRSAGNIYRMNADAKSIEIYATNQLLEPEIIGQNGIALSEDGRFLLTVKFLPARLMRISLENPNSIEEVTLINDTSESLTSGADALVVLDGDVYIAFDSEVVRAIPDDARWISAQITFHKHTLPDGSALSGVSGITYAEGALYVSKSDVVRFAVGLPPQLPFRLHRVDPAVFP